MAKKAPIKLSKEDRARYGELASRLISAQEGLAIAFEQYNHAVCAAHGALKEIVGEYDAIVAEAREFAAEMASNARSAIDERGDKWRDGGKGRAAESFADAWDEIDFVLEEFMPDDPVELDIDADGVKTFTGLPMEPGDSE